MVHRVFRLHLHFTLLGLDPKPLPLLKVVKYRLKGDTKMSKYKQVKINLEVDDHDKLQKYCSNENITMASFFRNLAEYKIENIREPRNTREHKTTDPNLLYQLNKMGINLNQIAKYANQNQEVDLKVLMQLASIEKLLKEFLK